MGLALDELNGHEQTVRVNDIEVMLDDQVKPFIVSQVLDYVTTKRGEGFRISPAEQKGFC